jgi:hypothetical protein
VQPRRNAAQSKDPDLRHAGLGSFYCDDNARGRTGTAIVERIPYVIFAGQLVEAICSVGRIKQSNDAGYILLA